MKTSVEDDGAQTAENPFDESAFNAALSDILRRAYQNGVPVKGAWESRNEGDVPDWDIQITEVAKRTDNR